jgi:hypothetical protein
MEAEVKYINTLTFGGKQPSSDWDEQVENV